MHSFAAFDIPDTETTVGFVSIRVDTNGLVTAEHHPVTVNADMLSPTATAAVLRIVADAIELSAVNTVADIDTGE